VFAEAARHSRRVRLLRRGVPIVITVILGATILVSWIDPLKVLVRLPLDAGKLVVSGTRITMQAPKLSGYTKDQRWYEMNAAGATQDITKPDFIELSEVRTKIETADKSTIHIRSKDGLYNRKTSMLTLTHDVVLTSTAGYEMHLDEATVDTSKGMVVSDKPVAVFTKDTTLTSDRFEVENSGEVVRFIGSVVMNLQSVGSIQQPGAAQPTTAPTTTAKPAPTKPTKSQQPASKR
jgi:lipopolysaccharide export system protein LptC